MPIIVKHAHKDPLFQEVKDLVASIAGLQLLRGTVCLIKRHKSMIISANVRARNFKDEVFTLTFMPNLESLR